MKPLLKLWLNAAAILVIQAAFAQTKNDHSVKINTMQTNTNKEAIRNLYENILNNGKFDLLGNIISGEYTNAQGAKGVEGFKKTVTDLRNAFPDAKWTLTAIVAEADRVFIKQKMEGTHKGIFQGITPTDKIVTTEGTVLYDFKDGKIIHSQVLTDRFGFLQQLGVIPADLLSLARKSSETIYFVDRFTIPAGSFNEFMSRTTYNRDFIKHLEGFVKDEVMVSKDSTGNIVVMTVAAWLNKDYLEAAKKKVQEEYARIGFDPQVFCSQLGITMERQVYSAYQQ
ncbi:MAG: ester cyclase [Chitinophagaceae bacterium]